MDKKIKILIVVILCFLVFLYYRKENSKEHFECVKIDKSLFCPKDEGDIDDFRVAQDVDYKTTIEDRVFYNYISKLEKTGGGDLTDIIKEYKFNYINLDRGDVELKKFNNYNELDDNKFNHVLKLNKNAYYKYDFIECSTDKLQNATNHTKIMTPSGVLFDKFNDDIIVFDAYRLRRYAYRDLRIKKKNSDDSYPILDSMAVEIKTDSDTKRNELLELIYALKNLDNLNPIDLTNPDIYNKDDIYIFEEVNKIKFNLNIDINKTKKFNITTKIPKEADKNDEKTGLEWLSKIKDLENTLKSSEKFKKCLDEVNKVKNNEKVCRIKYQKDLPSFEMGDIEGTGVEDMQYDDDKPPTMIHSTYLDTRMSPWSNTWNNVESEGIFSPLIVSRVDRMKIIHKEKLLNFNDGIIDIKSISGEIAKDNRGSIVGIKQNSTILDPKEKAQLYNNTIINPLALDAEKTYLDKKLSIGNNFVIETFTNKDAFKELNSKTSTKNKIDYGYPSLKLANNKNFSIGVYHIPDEIDSTGIGMEIVDTGTEQIILVPDVYNNRIQVFKKDKSELIYFGQFGNLDYTSSRSLPIYDIKHTAYEPIHNTEKYNSEPGCEFTCKFDSKNKYIGAKKTDLMGRKCENWNDYKVDKEPNLLKQLDNTLKVEGLKPAEEEFMKGIREKIKNNEALRNKCLSFTDDKPVCIINDEGKHILSKCFNNYETETDIGEAPVNNQITCDAWLKEYTDRYGPIDANFCLGDEKCVFECNPKYSNRRANIHHRQIGYKDNDTEIYRKRGHFYSILDEFNRCKDGIQQEKDTGNRVFSDSEFINPHFLGVDSQACVGKKKPDGNCAFRDTRNTSGTDNCSLGYRKYLLKMINITNQGQKFGQLFHPKSIAYDDVDKKYYIVDCYHHSVQCYELKEDKIVTGSGEKLKFVCADEEFNNRHVFYYDDDFKTGNSLAYNKSGVYSLGLRQNMLYENDFDSFSRLGEVSDDVSEYAKNQLIGKETLKKINQQIIEMEKNKDEITKSREIYKSSVDEAERKIIKRKMIEDVENTKIIVRNIINDFQKMPMGIIDEPGKESKIKKAESILETLISLTNLEDPEVKEAKERKKRVAGSKVEEINVPKPGLIESSMPNNKRKYPERCYNHEWCDSTMGAYWGYHSPLPYTNYGSVIIGPFGGADGVFFTSIRTWGAAGGNQKWAYYNSYVRNWKIAVGMTPDAMPNIPNTPSGGFRGHRDGTRAAYIQKTIKLPQQQRGRYIQIKGVKGRSDDGAIIFRCEVDYHLVEKKKIRKYKNRLINDEGYFIREDGTVIETSASTPTTPPPILQKVKPVPGTAPNTVQDVKFSKEKGYSMISPNWAEKYSDTKIRLNRWVSGISEWGNHVYAGFKDNIDYKKINTVGDYYFNTEKGGAGEYPGCGEFSYPSDIAISKNSCLGQGIQVMMVTDTGNNRVSIFKKYNLEGNMRFRFYSFLADEEDKEENKEFINPISVCISSVSGNVFVLEANFYNHLMNYKDKKNDIPSQRIKVFYPDMRKNNYYWSHNIQINEFLTTEKYDNLLNIYGDKKIEPRITKIRIDDRGILALTDINNNKVHLLKESLIGDFSIKKIDDSALNKVMIDIYYDPYKDFKSYSDRDTTPIINHDRIRFMFQRQRVCAFQNGDVILSKEFKTGNIPFGKYKKKFQMEDVREKDEFDNCWVTYSNTDRRYLDIDNIKTNEKTGEKYREETNRPNFDIDKKYNSDGSLNNYEDWLGKSLEPNSSYYYKIFVYNYNFIKDTENTIDKIVQTYPLYLSDNDIIPKSIITDKENYISLGINYDYDSKKYNPICFTILRRIHNRTSDIVTKNINCIKGSKIQLFIPKQSKIIFQIKSRPKLGRLYYYDIEKGGEFGKNLVELERGIEYGDNKYIIFYSCEGGDKLVGGYSIPDKKTSGRDTLIDSFTLGDKLETVHTQIKYNITIDITRTDNKVVMFKDNGMVDDNMKYYKKDNVGKDSADLEKLVKLSYAKKIGDGDGEYVYPGIIEYCDKGINLGPDNNRPIEMNQTYEYVILVSNPFKVNPAVNSFYYTTKPEMPYIHSVEFDKQAKENKQSLFTGSKIKDEDPSNNKVTIDGGEEPNELDIAKVTWYYPKNRSGYWPLNYIVLRKDISNIPIAIEPNTYDIDFNNVVRLNESDKLFRILKKSLKLNNNSDSSAEGTFNRKYDLGKMMDWKIKLFGTSGIEAMINNENYDWSMPFIEIKQSKYLNISIKLKGSQQITNITCNETVIIDEEEDDTIRNSRAPIQSVDPQRLKALQQYELEKSKVENQKIKRAVENYRQSSRVNFIFNLGDDYQGFYSNIANSKKTGKTGSLYRYIKDFEKDQLLNIFDELHNEMKIYHGDIGLRMDGNKGMLRSGDREMLIDKIRHFAFILREQKKGEYKSMGVECGEVDLNDIKIVTSNDGDEPKLEAIICKNLDALHSSPAPSLDIFPSPSGDFIDIGVPEELSSAQCSSLPNTGLKVDGTKKIITDVRTLGECCYKCQMSTECEVAEYIENDKKCEIHKSYDYNNEIPNQTGSTLLGKTKTTFDAPIEVEPPSELAPAQEGEEEVIPSHLSEWEVIKTIYRKDEEISNYTFRYPKILKEVDRKKIQKEFAFQPTLVSLSSDPEGLIMSPMGSDESIEFSSHEISIPLPKGKRYSYKLAVYQTGFNLDTEEKRRFMGVETKNTDLGLGEVYSNEIELGESIQQLVIINKPPLMPIQIFKEPKVKRPVIKFFDPVEGDANSIIRVVGIKLDEIEYFSFRDVKVKVLKKQERIIGNIKYQEYLIKPPSIKELERNCWQSIEKYRVLLWGYWHGYQIISSQGNDDKTKMFTYTSLGDCVPDKK